MFFNYYYYYYYYFVASFCSGVLPFFCQLFVISFCISWLNCQFLIRLLFLYYFSSKHANYTEKKNKKNHHHTDARHLNLSSRFNPFQMHFNNCENRRKITNKKKNSISIWPFRLYTITFLWIIIVSIVIIFLTIFSCIHSNSFLAFWSVSNSKPRWNPTLIQLGIDFIIHQNTASNTLNEILINSMKSNVNGTCCPPSI